MFRFLRELPITLVRWISDGIEVGFARMLRPFDSEEDDEPRRRAWWQWIWLAPLLAIYWVFRLGVVCLSFPGRAFFFPASQRNCYLRGLPALLIAGVVTATILGYIIFRDRFLPRYAARAYTSFTQNQPALAKRYATRLMTTSRGDRQENRFVYALALAQSGDEAAASEVFAMIAPDDAIGYPSAHQLRALEIVQGWKDVPDDESLERLHWHLTQAGSKDNEQLLALWARYYQASGQLDEAAKTLTQAGEKNPLYYLNLWDLQVRRNNDAGAKSALESARDGFASQLNSNPLSKALRLQLALTLNKLQRWEEAERILLAGLQMHRDAEMQSAASGHFVARYDSAIDTKTTIAERFSWLTRAMGIDLNNRGIYERLVTLFEGKLTADESQQLKRMLEENLVSGANSGIAHFGLGCMNLFAPDRGQQRSRHFKQSIELLPSLAVACNNLSITLMQHEPPHLEVALELAELASASNPEIANFRETLGAVLLELKEYERGIETLKLVLDQSPNPKAIHAQLAKAYKALGRDQEAEQHANWSQ